ncbi:MAG TPA: hypothetical protein DDW33_05435, partial [Ktedonobacter sp.]|nr:hypothetical protein [Ktedonobacter sp.]
MRHFKQWNIFLILLYVIGIVAWRVLPTFPSHSAQAQTHRHGTSTTLITHAVIIMMENHTFDNYFGRFPGANGRNDLPLA